MKTAISKLSLFLLAGTLLLGSCSKTRNKWDEELNGTWVEVDQQSGSKLSYGSEVVFNDNYMTINGSNVSATFSDEDNLVYADDNQIYGTWKILVRKHIEYLYDYQIIDKELWLVPDNSAGSAPSITTMSSAMRFKRK